MNKLELWAQLSPGTIALHYAVMLIESAGILYLLGLAFYFIERIRPAQPQQSFFKNDFRSEVGYPLFNAAVTTPIFTFLSLGMGIVLLEPYVPKHILEARVTTLPFALQVLFALLVTDIGICIEHQIAHRFLWRFHRLHHSTPEVGWLTHARVHPINALTIAVSGMLSHWVLGFSGEAVVWGATIGTFVAVWEHCNMDFAWPKPLCYLLVSPHYHRWHHSSSESAVDKNFCLVFPFLDLLMGTYYCPDEKPAATGLTDAELRRNPVPETFADQLVQSVSPSRRTAQDG